MNTHKLFLTQLSEKLKTFDSLKNLPRPNKGWISTIRLALGMSTTYLAKRVGVNQSVISRLERSEIENTITLKSLQTIADALDCKLVYALVPNTSLENTIRQQAEKIARERLQQTSHHMLLEKQNISKEKEKSLYEDLLKEFLSGHPKKIWK